MHEWLNQPSWNKYGHAAKVTTNALIHINKVLRYQFLHRKISTLNFGATLICNACFIGFYNFTKKTSWLLANELHGAESSATQISYILWNPEVHYHVNEHPLPARIPSQINDVLLPFCKQVQLLTPPTALAMPHIPNSINELIDVEMDCPASCFNLFCCNVIRTCWICNGQLKNVFRPVCNAGHKVN